MENNNEQMNTGFEFHGEIRFPYYLMTITKKFKNREDAISYRDELSKKIKEAISKKTEYIEIENNIIIPLIPKVLAILTIALPFFIPYYLDYKMELYTYTSVIGALVLINYLYLIIKRKQIEDKLFK